MKPLPQHVKAQLSLAGPIERLVNLLTKSTIRVNDKHRLSSRTTEEAEQPEHRPKPVIRKRQPSVLDMTTGLGRERIVAVDMSDTDAVRALLERGWHRT